MANKRKKRRARKPSARPQNNAAASPNPTAAQKNTAAQPKQSVTPKAQAQTKPAKAAGNSFTLTVGREELTIRQRYQTLSIANDFLIAIWFLLGSLFFLYPWLETPGIWMFIIGSAQFLIRPAIRLAHQIHLKRLPGSRWEL